MTHTKTNRKGLLAPDVRRHRTARKFCTLSTLANMSDHGAALDEVLSSDSGSSTQNSSTDSIETSASTAPSLNLDSSDSAPPQGSPEYELADRSGRRPSVANQPSQSNDRPADEEEATHLGNTNGDDPASPTNSSSPLERTDSRFSEVTLSFLTGWFGPQWRKTLVVHCVLALILNALALGLGIYSAFWGDSSVQQNMSNMQKVLTDKLDDSTRLLPSNQTLEQLLALEKWNSFNSWIQSCATYAVRNSFLSSHQSIRLLWWLT